MKLFFDFDDFFFDTENDYARDVFGLLRSATGATKQEVDEAAAAFSVASFGEGLPYTVERHVDSLAERHTFDTKKVKDIMNTFYSDVSRYLFPGTEEFLSRFKKEYLYLLTFGGETYQRMKIEKSGIGKYFREIIVAKGNKLDEIEVVRKRDGIPSDEEIIFSDNRCEYFTGAKERGIIGIHLKRPGDKYSLNPCGECEYRVSDFEELSRLIERIRSGA